MKLKAIIVLTLAAFALPAISVAHSHEGHGHKDPKGERTPDMKFQKIDANEDGFLTKAEVAEAGKKRLEKHFDKIDADGDGRISKDEMKAYHEKKAEKKQAKKKERAAEEE